MSPTLTPNSIFRPCLSKAFLASLAICVSTAPKNVGRPSKMVTSEPKRRQTEPISKPITPEPISTNFRGTEPRDKAPSLDKICVSSKGTPGKARAVEPVATMTFLPITVSCCAPLTKISYAPSCARLKEARPWKKLTLFFLNKYKIPSLFCLTTLSLRAIILATSKLTPLSSMPCSEKW